MNLPTPLLKKINAYIGNPLCIALTSALVLSACDVSNGGGGGSQDPDPVAVDLPIAYISRPIPRDENGDMIVDDIISPSAFKPGAKLIMKDRASVPAAEFVVTDKAFAELDENGNIVGEVPLYDVKDLETSSDGLKLVFAMRAPEIPDAEPEDQPTWNIWEYDRETEILRRVISSNLVAEEGHDVAPHYLPDGRIVFSSNRQTRSKAILLDENKPQFPALAEGNMDNAEGAYLLHVLEEDGSKITQISYNQSHDLQPTVLDSGEILFLRWDAYGLQNAADFDPADPDAPANNAGSISLYKANPNGSNPTLLYGFHSQNSGTGLDNDDNPNNELIKPIVFSQPRELADGRIMVIGRPRQSQHLGGDILVIDVENYFDNTQATYVNGDLSEPAQTSLTTGVTYTDNGSLSPHGRFSSAYPLNDSSGRYLVSWSNCLVEGIGINVYVTEDNELINEDGEFVDGRGNAVTTPEVVADSELSSFPCTDDNIQVANIKQSPVRYGLWIYSPSDRLVTPVVLAERDHMFTEAIVLEDKPIPNYVPDPIPGVDVDQSLFNGNLGVVHIRSVYDIDGVDTSPAGLAATADPTRLHPSERPAQFIRIVKAVSMPDQDVKDFDPSAFGRAGRQMKDILGYVPIEPDGSAMFAVPADVAFSISILDGNGRRIEDDRYPRHRNWLSVRAGEVRQCNGCHQEDSTQPHGRIDAEAPSINPGALSQSPFPNTRLFDADNNPYGPPVIGETMAEYYARVNGVRIPSVDIQFVDDWTNPTIQTKADSFTYSYLDLLSGIPPLTRSDCITNWDGLCRIVINYAAHIQPIWEQDRRVFDPADPAVLLEDRTCISCHSRTDAMLQTMIPAGQVELTGETSVDRNDYVTSYAELLFRDVNQIIDPVTGNLINEQVQEVVDGVPQFEVELDANGDPVLDANGNPVLRLDADGNPIPILVDVPAPPQVLSPNGANASQRFFALFDTFGSHEGYLNPAELKLISEWLDVGGQYYNNPFAAPDN
ncbi:hypothetical protein [Teredinibacter sp. KSP-S5-2]|uniref:HzsA-related protein n=1 Tax=Teredinibacter sp. KSP-S5-2 TaxID=3034506 RepID=UPI0029343557|nr:hypothetical protein [Teredinibacter sp. KSP-S5-2]WNO08953.1 hypothetical protein P5V12_18565 [Teredinibacter sp. KSP-S5-2]